MICLQDKGKKYYVIIQRPYYDYQDKMYIIVNDIRLSNNVNSVNYIIFNILEYKRYINLYHINCNVSMPLEWIIKAETLYDIFFPKLVLDTILLIEEYL